MKVIWLVVSIISLFLVGCATDNDSKALTRLTPLNSASDIALKSRSGVNGQLLPMTTQAEPTEDQKSYEGEWVTKTDSTGTSTEFVSSSSTSGLSSSTSFVHSDSSGTISFSTMSTRSEIVTMDSKLVPSVLVPSVQPAVSAGLLTAGEWYDHKHWSDFQKFIRDYPEYFCKWKLNLQRRVVIKVVDENEIPVPGAKITIKLGEKTVFNGLSLGDGSVAFFPLNSHCNENENYHVKIKSSDLNVDADFQPVTDDDQTWVVKIPGTIPAKKPKLDIVFTVDVTGSMADELTFIQSELIDICNKIYSGQASDLRIGFVFYRDRGDMFVTKVLNFTSDFVSAKENISRVNANGGGDFPESVNLALKQTMQNLEWRNDDNCIRLCFIVADAPPHYYRDEQYTYSDALNEAVSKGIKIVPVAGSGIDKSTEYLFRHMAAKTMGKYIFLTNHSGIGESHIAPDVSSYEVEKLNDIIVRTVKNELDAWQCK